MNFENPSAAPLIPVMVFVVSTTILPSFVVMFLVIWSATVPKTENLSLRISTADPILCTELSAFSRPLVKPLKEFELISFVFASTDA